MKCLVLEVFAFNPSGILIKTPKWNNISPNSHNLSLASRAWPSKSRLQLNTCKHINSWKHSLMRFASPTARSISSPLTSGLPDPIRSTYRFSQPLSGLLLETPGGLISCHWHSWGSPSRVFPLKAAPFSRRDWLPQIVEYLSPLRKTGAGLSAKIVWLNLPEDRCSHTNTHAPRY